MTEGVVAIIVALIGLAGVYLKNRKSLNKDVSEKEDSIQKNFKVLLDKQNEILSQSNSMNETLIKTNRYLEERVENLEKENRSLHIENKEIKEENTALKSKMLRLEEENTRMKAELDLIKAKLNIS